MFKLLRPAIELASLLSVIDLFQSHSLAEILHICTGNDFMRLGLATAILLACAGLADICRLCGDACRLPAFCRWLRRRLGIR